jgi:hypothetical protein
MDECAEAVRPSKRLAVDIEALKVFMDQQLSRISTGSKRLESIDCEKESKYGIGCEEASVVRMYLVPIQSKNHTLLSRLPKRHLNIRIECHYVLESSGQ